MSKVVTVIDELCKKISIRAVGSCSVVVTLNDLGLHILVIVLKKSKDAVWSIFIEEWKKQCMSEEVAIELIKCLYSFADANIVKFLL